MRTMFRKGVVNVATGSTGPSVIGSQTLYSMKLEPFTPTVFNG